MHNYDLLALIILVVISASLYILQRYIVIPTRYIMGIILSLSTYLFAISLWINSMMVTYEHVELKGVLLGLLLGGIGIIPVAFITCISCNDWFSVGYLAASIGIIYLLSKIGKAVMKKYETEFLAFCIEEKLPVSHKTANFMAGMFGYGKQSYRIYQEYIAPIKKWIDVFSGLKNITDSFRRE